MPRGEAAYCIPCLTELLGRDSTNPDPDGDGAQDRVELLAGRACAVCYAALQPVEQSFVDTGMVRLCGECASGLREVADVLAG